ncbi:MAG: M50 family metallopeptidase [Lachnospiraceae bacterium]|nr:M50 family metallopeptidase [Lachnospiraceae bacterium]
MIVNHLGEMYLLVYVCIFVHEAGHAVAALMIGVKVKSFQIGDDLFAVKAGRVSVSLNPFFGSGVSFCEDQLRTKGRRHMAFFFLAGIAFSIVTIVIGVIVSRINSLYGSVLVWTSAYCVAFSSMPWCPWNSDVKQLRRFLRVHEK